MKSKAIVLTCFIGTALEWYDFSLFGILASILSEVFFPHNDPAISLLKTFAVFSVGFLIRPIAALYWGYVGDKLGRKKAVTIIISIMTLSTVGIGLLPSYETIGIGAPILLVIFRLLQGFSASGEHAGMLAYLYEVAPSTKKGIYSSISISGVFAGMSLAIFSSLIVHQFLSKQMLYQWGWRLPFLLSSILGVVALIFIKKLVESTEFAKYIHLNNKIFTKQWMGMLREHTSQLIRATGLFQLAVIIPYIVFVYMVAIVIKNDVFSSASIYLITFCNLAMTSVLVMFFGYIGEQYNKWLYTISISCVAVGAIFIFPWFFSKNVMLFAFAQGYFGFFTAMFVGPLCSMLSQLFLPQIRYTGIALSLNIAATLFGGISPLILALFQLTKWPILYSIVFIIVSCGVAGICKITEKNELTYASQSLLR